MSITELFFFLLYLAFVNTDINTVRKDFRYISYQDLQLSFDKFHQSGVTSYAQMLFDVARNQVFVGARDGLYRLSLPKLQLMENATWAAPEEKVMQCIQKGQHEQSCHNFIKVLHTDGNNIFTCGTNAFSPQCTWRDINDITRVTASVDGIAKCPYNPHANVTGLMAENGEYYFGGSTDFSASDYLISRSIGQNSTIRTTQYDSMSLNEPQFVGSFETNNFVYFLFREAAVEYINCGKIVYSRIARMCKSDRGGIRMLKDNWTTFVKARLNCSISGDYPFYFDEIQSMSYVPDENIVYATFQTPSNSIAGSAICAFNLTSINNAFNGPFKHQEHPGSSWSKKMNVYQSHYECNSMADPNILTETYRYHLMDNAVQATTLSPLHVAEGERFTHITIDVLPTKLYMKMHVVYVATMDGLVKKITVLPRTQETCIVEIWQPVPNSHIQINTMQYLKIANSLYIGTDTAVLRIPVHHCSRHVSRDSCLNAMDPYCGWDELEDACMPAPQSEPLATQWKQSVTSCPILDAPIDGGWSSWSEYTPCIHRSGSEFDVGDSCLCQTRTCNNPAPQNGGLDCTGPSTSVTNCTVHGGWTPWSAWSACSATCGMAVKTRTRTCTNPTPAHGGRVCVGQELSEVVCTGIPPCPIATPPPQDGGWAPWEDWGPCSAPCGGGFRKRHRVCNDPLPKYGGQDCTGCNVEYDICNTHSCPEQRKLGPWTPWLISSNTTNGEYTEKRFRINCRGPVQDQLQLKISSKEEIRTCRSGSCFSSGIDDLPRWSGWSAWSECSAPCGGGYQNKTRYCEGRGECQGASVQTRVCNTHSCHGEWGCWSDWSPCSATCGWGIRTRYRVCMGQKCEGPERDEEACEVAPCESLLGWESWSAWSLCDENKEQRRSRKCKSSKPSSQMCQGSTVETRMCVHTGQAQEVQIDAASMPAGVIIACMLAGFILGVICCGVMMFLYLRKKKTSIPSSPHYITAKQNSYITVPLQDRPSKKQSASTSNTLLNNVHNGTLKSKCYDYDTATIKRNSHGLNNGHNKQEYMSDDKFLFD